MANCQKNSNYLILDFADQQVRDTALSVDGKTFKINLKPSGTNECTFNIDAAGFTGLKIIGKNLQVVDPIPGLKQQKSEKAGKAQVRVEKDGSGVLRIIGIEDTIMNLEANLRYDAVTDEVIMEY